MRKKGKAALARMSMAEFVKPVETMMVVSRPEALASGALRTVAGGSGLVAPVTSESRRVEAGRICKVLAVGPDVEDYSPGMHVMLPEFAGQPIGADADADEAHLVAASEVSAVIDEQYFEWLKAIAIKPLAIARA